MSDVADAVDALVREAEDVRVQRFPIGNEVDLREALAFLLGVTPEGAEGVAHGIADVVDREAGRDATKHSVFQLTLFHAIIFGVAAQRLNAIEVPT